MADISSQNTTTLKRAGQLVWNPARGRPADPPLRAMMKISMQDARPIRLLTHPARAMKKPWSSSQISRRAVPQTRPQILHVQVTMRPSSNSSNKNRSGQPVMPREVSISTENASYPLPEAMRMILPTLTLKIPAGGNEGSLWLPFIKGSANVTFADLFLISLFRSSVCGRSK